jgi:hypothetical protein
MYLKDEFSLYKTHKINSLQGGNVWPSASSYIFKTTQWIQTEFSIEGLHIKLSKTKTYWKNMQIPLEHTFPLLLYSELILTINLCRI